MCACVCACVCFKGLEAELVCPDGVCCGGCGELKETQCVSLPADTDNQ